MTRRWTTFNVDNFGMSIGIAILRLANGSAPTSVTELPVLRLLFPGW
jgi:hypothetical protein